MPPKSKKKVEVTASGRLGEPRLMIKKIEMENFKSYAGIQEIGPFHKCFSSIVGPNGSGKSNVIDALLFVFGRKANKIRLKKISELIHNGSAKKLNSCRVSVHFCDIIDHLDNDEGYDIVPGSEIVISRSADTSNTSKYYMNGKLSTFTDVGNKLRTKGVDLDNNRFLILQGEVEQIAMMKPKAAGPGQDGLLEYLEDLIGSNTYVEAIEEAFQQVEGLNDQRQEKLNRVKLVEKEKDSLEGAKSEAEEYLLKENELHVITASMYQLFQHESKSNALQAQGQKEELTTQLEYERKKLAETTEKLVVQEQEYGAKKAEFDEIAEELVKTKADFSAFERKDVKHREDLKHEAAQKKKLKSKGKKLADDLGKLEAKLAAAEEGVPTLEAKLEELAADKEAADGRLDKLFESLKGKTEPIKLQMEEKQQELIPLRRVTNEFQQNVSVCEAELSLFKEKTAKAALQFEHVQKQLASHDDRVQARTTALAEADAATARDQARLVEAQQELQHTQQQAAALSATRQRVRGQSAECRQGLSTGRNRGMLLTSLMKEKKKGRLNGLHGRLGELGSIDAKYDVAITTACPALNNLVVDDTVTGSKCIEYLRQHKLGRATFMILQKIAHVRARADKACPTPEGVPRLFDLIQPKDEAYRTAFYSAVGDTLVAKDMEQAVRIAYGKSKRWRVVTMDGKLIDTSGTMSGGGNKVRRGGMSSHAQQSNDGGFTEKDLAKFEQALREAEQQLGEVQAAEQRLEGEIRRLKAALSKAVVAAKKARLGLQSLVKEKAQLTARLEALQGGLQLTGKEEERVASLKKELQQQGQQLGAAKKGTEKLEADIAGLEARIMAAGGDQLRKQQAVVDGLGLEVDLTGKSITKAKVELSSGAKKLKKWTKDLADTKAALETSEATLANLRGEFKQIEDDALEVLSAYKEAQKQQDTKGKELESIQKEYESFKKVVESVRGVEVDICNRVEDYDRVIADNNNKAKHWGRKLSGIQTKIRHAEKVIGGAVEAEEDEEEGKEADNRAARASKRDKDTMEDDEEGEEEKEETNQEEEQQKEGKYTPLTEEAVSELKKDKLQYQITMLEESLKLMKPNMKAIAEYRKKEQEYASRAAQLDQTTQERDQARQCYDGLRKKRLDQFMAGFGTITMKLKEMYQMLTLGGDAELELVDSLDPFSEGIVFSVRPPKKSWKNIQNLSGGEKTLSSLALVFALHHFKPTPLYVMDEIDAALDFKNVSIVGNYIKERTKDAQFIVISLRNNMFELADRLVGIYKTDNATKSISIDPRKFSMPAAVPGGQVETSG